MSFPITEASPPRFAGVLPPRADVVVIGGGVIGVMTSWFLRDRGLSVVVCEKGRIAGVVTEAGNIACDHVVVAAGAWSRLFLRTTWGSYPAAVCVGLGGRDRTDARDLPGQCGG